MELIELPGIGETTAEKLREAGVENIEQVAELDIKKLEELGVKKRDAPEALKIAKEIIEKTEPGEEEGILDIWRLQKQIPNFLFKAFIKTLKTPEKLSEKELDNKYDGFMKREIFKKE
ncbi:DNA repair and recombination protein RadA [Methanobrevibacter cuticularis]|uniref:DNA repair and recombination protein RadA n=1 Tax=Methanobrevibacter cuticularis TaxID=47311 RepID=A0A166EH06_9EURY|nr:helix-hairpin-helix domain-containing protein [Methanobrevibacter cuticularis]KZX16646.1 DNA repair and recombination protein RadA [Methanobrevibacter cuticularis]